MSFNLGGGGQQQYVPTPPPPPPPPNPATFANKAVQDAGNEARKRAMGFGGTMLTGGGENPIGSQTAPTAGKQLLGQ